MRQFRLILAAFLLRIVLSIVPKDTHEGQSLMRYILLWVNEEFKIYKPV